jgi:alpha-L-rhamnosidase
MFTPRRTFWSLTVFVFGILFVPGVSSSAADAPPAPANLRVEYLTNPMGVDSQQPRFFWVLTDSRRGQGQSAYEVLVANSREQLAKDHGDMWDSGKVASDDSIQVAYRGKALESGASYFWKVRTWDKDGAAGPYSEVAHFDMGLLSASDWQGQWIGGANELRTEVELADAPTRARAYICGLGYSELFINGRKVGDKVLDPAWTTYPKRVLYSTYEVTLFLHRGKNAIAVMLGEGWYKARALLLQVNVDLANGNHVSITSNTAYWKIHPGPVVEDSVYGGEVYDATKETPGWELPGYDDAGWTAAAQVKAPGGVLSSEMMPAIEVVDTLVPRFISNPQPGVYVYDLGQNFSGWARLRVQGPRGTRVQIRYAEVLYANGMINRDNIRAAKSRDIYILRGDATPETYEARFTYHGFRYVEVTGLPGTPGIDSLRGRVVHTAVTSAGDFTASKQILNRIQDIIRWGQSTNLHSVPTDCDQRDERQGWLGDAQVTGEEAMLNFDMAAFYINFIRDIHDIQGADGSVTDTVPHFYGSRPADPAWGTAYPQLCWYMYQQYGDRRILEENYEGLKKYVEFLRSKASNNVLSYSYYGDWVALAHTPGAVVSDSFYYYDTQILSQMARILGNSADAAAYDQLAGQIKDAFNHEFFDPKTGNYANGTQTANALALFLNLVPEKERGSVVGNLTNDIVYAHNTHLTTGFIGVKYLFPVLEETGNSDLAYELATQTTYPSWGYMVEKGATTLWELWQDKVGPSMNSHNHPMFGSVGAWFYQGLAGIKVDEHGAGYRHFTIAPQVEEDLTEVSGTVETVRGRVSAHWTHEPNRITLDVQIPANSDAQVAVPWEEQMTTVVIREGGHVVWENNQFVPGVTGITAARKTGSTVTFDVASGHYAFQMTGE